MTSCISGRRENQLPAGRQPLQLDALHVGGEVAQLVQIAFQAGLARRQEKIVDNIHITVRRLHIRVEDEAEDGRPLSVGLSVRSLSAVTTNDEWQAEFQPRAATQQFVRKAVRLQGLAFYVNTAATHFADDADVVHNYFEHDPSLGGGRPAPSSVRQRGGQARTTATNAASTWWLPWTALCER